MALLGLYNYFVFAVLLMIGLYCVLARPMCPKNKMMVMMTMSHSGWPF